MIGKLKPVVILKTDLDWGEGLLANNLADELDIDDSDIPTTLERIKNTNVKVLQDRKDKLYGEIVFLESTLKSILK